MKASRQSANVNQQRRLRRTLGATAIAAALCLGATACSNNLLGGADTDATPKQKHSQRTQGKPTEKSVRAFYARATDAYRTRNAHQLCKMTQPAYAAAMVKEATDAGLDVSTCPEMWQAVIEFEPKAYKDKVTKISVKGKTATLLSGDDPWRLRLVHGKWLMVG